MKILWVKADRLIPVQNGETFVPTTLHGIWLSATT